MTLTCRSDAETKGHELEEVSASRDSLQQQLADLKDGHAAQTEQYKGLQAEMRQTQAALHAAAEGKASAEVMHVAHTREICTI